MRSYLFSVLAAPFWLVREWIWWLHQSQSLWFGSLWLYYLKRKIKLMKLGKLSFVHVGFFTQRQTAHSDTPPARPDGRLHGTFTNIYNTKNILNKRKISSYAEGCLLAAPERWEHWLHQGKNDGVMYSFSRITYIGLFFFPFLFFWWGEGGEGERKEKGKEPEGKRRKEKM